MPIVVETPLAVAILSSLTAILVMVAGWLLNGLTKRRQGNSDVAVKTLDEAGKDRNRLWERVTHLEEENRTQAEEQHNVRQELEAEVTRWKDLYYKLLGEFQEQSARLASVESELAYVRDRLGLDPKGPG